MPDLPVSEEPGNIASGALEFAEGLTTIPAERIRTGIEQDYNIMDFN